MKKAVDQTKKLEEFTNQLLELMGTKAVSKCSLNKEEGIIDVNIDTESETGLLIGRKGETLNALQVILGIAYKKQSGEWLRINVNVGDYKEKQEEYLKGIATEAAKQAKITGEEQPLYNLTPSQRRIVHMELSSVEGVSTESRGEGEDRYLVVLPKI